MAISPCEGVVARHKKPFFEKMNLRTGEPVGTGGQPKPAGRPLIAPSVTMTLAGRLSPGGRLLHKAIHKPQQA